MIMKFQEMVFAHYKWREDIQKSIETGIPVELILDVHCDDICQIGQWFHADGQHIFSDLAEFAEAKKQHLLYHQAVAKSLREEQVLGADDEFDIMIEAFNDLNMKIGHMD